MLIFFDLFAGIGGFRLGMTMAGHKCVGWCENDKFAQKAYMTMYNPVGEWFYDDATKLDPRKMPDFDVLCAGFPCQAFSVCGNRKGFQDARGTLFFDIARIAQEKQPRILFLENVKGLLSHDKGKTFRIILSTLDELGYDAEWQVLDSKNFGVPQNRERVYIIGYLRGTGRPKVLPIRETNPKAVKQIIGGKQGERVYDPNGLSVTLKSCGGGQGAKTGLYLIGNIYANNGQNGNVYHPSGIAPALRSGQGIKGRGIGSSNAPKVLVPISINNGRIKLRNDFTCLDANYSKGLDNHSARTGVLAVKGDLLTRKNPQRQYGFSKDMFTLRSSVVHGVILDCFKIRRLTPLECWRLQGFPDEYFYIAKRSGLSDTQLYKLAGNAVTIPVVYEIASRLEE